MSFRGMSFCLRLVKYCVKQPKTLKTKVAVHWTGKRSIPAKKLWTTNSVPKNPKMTPPTKEEETTMTSKVRNNATVPKATATIAADHGLGIKSCPKTNPHKAEIPTAPIFRQKKEAKLNIPPIIVNVATTTPQPIQFWQSKQIKMARLIKEKTEKMIRYILNPKKQQKMPRNKVGHKKSAADRNKLSVARNVSIKYK